MTTLRKESILRINCPGFGTSAFLNLDSAKTLAEYQVIIINPTSIIHMFDKNPELLKQIELAQTEGSTSYFAKSDKLIESIKPDLDARIPELVTFLQNGGLLVYFLAPPFDVKGSDLSINNYDWLEALAPDKPDGKGERKMVASVSGRGVETNDQGRNSHFNLYLMEPGLGWKTIIRNTNLTEGYTVLATSGVNKCVAAQIEVGDNGGLVVFLPSPYNKDIDHLLCQSIESWFAAKPQTESAQTPDSPECAEGISAGSEQSTENATQAPECTTQPPESSTDKEPFFHEPSPDHAESPIIDFGAFENPQPDAAISESNMANESPLAVDSPLSAEAVAGNDFATSSECTASTTNTANEPTLDKDKYEYEPSPLEVAAQAVQEIAQEIVQELAHDIGEALPELKDAIMQDESNLNSEHYGHSSEHNGEPQTNPKEFIEKMEKVSNEATPDWCSSYRFTELSELHKELDDLQLQIRLGQERAEELGKRINGMEEMKSALLWSSEEDLATACIKVFEQLGWSRKPADNNKQEHLLSNDGNTEAIVRVVRTQSQAKRADLAQLAESVITYWGAHEVEPKGILITSAWSDNPPGSDNEPSYDTALADFAKKKHLCLMSTWQLLSIYRDLETGKAEAEGIRNQLLSTDGLLDGYMLEASATSEEAVGAKA